MNAKKTTNTWLVLTFCMLGSAVTFAADYVWSGGGEAGKWNDAGNWVDGSAIPVATVPGAGDTATFNESVAISDDINLDAGVLQIKNAASTTLTIDGVISGAGGIWKTGDGSLALKAANSFTGDFVTQGMNNGTGDASSHVFVYNGSALGKGKVYVDPDGGNVSNGGRIVFEAGEGMTMTVDNDISMGSAEYPTSKNYDKLLFRSGSFVMNGEISGVRRASLSGSADCASVFFNGNLALAGYFHLSGFSANSHVHFVGTIGCSAFLTYGCNATGHLYKGKTGYSDDYSMQFYSPFVLEVDDAVTTSIRSLGLYGQSGCPDAILDLNGHSQTFNYFWGTCNYGNDVTKSGITSPLDKPGKLVLKHISNPVSIKCPISGNVSLEIGAESSKALTISDSVSTTIGDIDVACGTAILSISGGGQFTRLGDVSLVSGSELELASDAKDCYSRELHLTTGSIVDIAEGRKWKTSHLFIDGIEQDGYRTYGSNDLAQVNGGGLIQVEVECNVFTGDVDADWSNAANWSYGVVPGVGDAVAVSASVAIGQETPKYSIVKVADGGVLTFTNRTAALNAETIIVSDGGLVTSSGPFTDENAAARVCLCCDSLTIEEGGSIDVSSKGWSGCLDFGVAGKPGCGPGAGKSGGNSAFGASHGGFGGRSYITTPLDYSLRYGDAQAPITAGSGGGRLNASSAPVHGGGVVRLNVTGEMIVDGVVRANGGDCREAAVDGAGFGDTGGAGGSVWITCGSISGSGTVSADGGAGSLPFPTFPMFMEASSDNLSRPGGGGRIAVSYDSARQEAKAPRIRISASEGRYTGRNPVLASTLATDDKYFTDAEPGTLALTDDVLFYQLLGRGLSGRVVGRSEVCVDGNLTYDWGHLRFDGDGVSFVVGGDLVISGEEARLEIGQCVITNLTPWNCKWTGWALNSLDVGGSLTVSDGAALDVRSAAKGSLLDFGAEVRVAGAMTVGAGGYVYAWCEATSPIPVRFSVGSLSVHEGGVFSADDRGAAGGWGAGNYVAACGGASYRGTGTGIAGADGRGNYGAGGSHGGLGGQAYDTTASPPGIRMVLPDKEGKSSNRAYSGMEVDAYLPCHPGAGGSCDGYGLSNPAGGGVIYVLSSGPIRVDGTISADAALCTSFNAKNYFHYMGCGAGGTVFLFGDTFSSGPTARISARGGDTPTTVTLGGAGGGGCVSVWTGRSNIVDGEYSPRQLKRLPVSTTPGDLGYGGVFDVSGGTNVAFGAKSSFPTVSGFEQVPESHGQDGTVRFASINPKGGFVLLVR